MINFTAFLLVSTLFGGKVLQSLGLAPMVFSALPSEDAGRFIRVAFSWYYLFVIITGCSSGAILFLSDSWSAALALAISAGAIYSLQVLMPRINAARDEQFQQNTEAKRLFLRLHGLSVVINFVQLIATGYVRFRLLRGTFLAL
jgi:hypothetical protein